MTSSNPKYKRDSSAADVAHNYSKRASYEESGKLFMITGGNCGLGYETALSLVAEGAEVILLCRSKEKGETAVKKILEVHPKALVSSMIIDLASFDSIRKFSEEFLLLERRLYCLINNAGVMAPPKSLTVDGYETQIAVNHYGHFLLTSLLMPALERGGSSGDPARVINVSSAGHSLFAPFATGIDIYELKDPKKYDPWIRYGESKLANVLFSYELTNRAKTLKKNIISVSLHPGAITQTNLMRNIDLRSSLLMGINLIWRPRSLYHVVTYPNLKNASQGASTTVFCALSPDIIPGEYYCDCAVGDFVHPLSKDKELAAKLWTESEKAVKQSFLSLV